MEVQAARSCPTLRRMGLMDRIRGWLGQSTSGAGEAAYESAAEDAYQEARDDAATWMSSPDAGSFAEFDDDERAPRDLAP